MDLAQIVDIFLHLDKHLEAVTAQYGPWVYGLLFAIIFVETGVVVMPFLPGDSLLVTAGVLVNAGMINPFQLGNFENLLLMNATLMTMAIVGDAVGLPGV